MSTLLFTVALNRVYSYSLFNIMVHNIKSISIVDNGSDGLFASWYKPNIRGIMVRQTLSMEKTEELEELESEYYY